MDPEEKHELGWSLDNQKTMWVRFGEKDMKHPTWTESYKPYLSYNSFHWAGVRPYESNNTAFSSLKLDSTPQIKFWFNSGSASGETSPVLLTLSEKKTEPKIPQNM